MRRAARTDANHREVRETLRRLGWSVLDLSDVGRGVADLLCHRGGILRMVEVKARGGSLTPRQRELIDEGWPIVVVRSVTDAVNLR